MSDEYQKLNTVAQIQSGFAYPSTSYETSGIPIIRMSDLKKGGLKLESAKYVSEKWLTTTYEYALKEFDFLLGMSGSIENHAYVGAENLPALLNQRVARLKLKNQAASYKYLCFWLSSDFYHRYADIQGEGAAQKNISAKQIESFRIRLPEIREQRKIATILTSIDTATEKTEALIAKYQQIKAGLMHDLFTRGVLPNGQLRPPREQAPELYQETAIGWIPREWSLISIGTAFDIQLGKMLNQDAKIGKSSFPYVGNRSVQWDRVDLDALEEMDFSPTEREKFSLKSGDLLVCEGGDVGRTAIWDCPVENCYYQKAIHRLRPKGNQVKPRFMLRFMWYAKNTGHFENYTSQTSIAHLTQEKLASVPMAAPSVDEQDRLIARFDGIDSILDREQDFLANLLQQKSGLMHDLLTGKVPVTIENRTTTTEAVV
jgi:type I restriction enzyme S subunit